MSQKTASQAMQFEVTGSKKVNGKSAAIKYAEQLGTGRLLWIVVKRHRIAILATGNVVLVLNWAFPEWPQLFLSLIGK